MTRRDYRGQRGYEGGGRSFTGPLSGFGPYVNTGYEDRGYGGPERQWGGRGYGERDYGYGGPRSGYGGSPERGWGGQDPGYGYGSGYGERGGWRGGEQGGFERPLWNRASDEVRSWFGDEEAERRRRMDEMRPRFQGRGPRGWRRSDERIKEDVNECLAYESGINAEDIEVSVHDNEVTLTGTVDSRSDKRRAEDLAEQVRGVLDVHNQLRIRREDRGQSRTAIPTTTGSMATGIPTAPMGRKASA